MKLLNWNKKLILTCFMMTGVLILLRGTAATAPDTKTRLRLALRKPGTYENVRLQYNRWDYRIANDGAYFGRPFGEYKAGGIYPRESGYDAIYAAGFYVGARKVVGTDSFMTVSDVEFDPEFQPGKLRIGGVKDSAGYRGAMGYDPSENLTGPFSSMAYDSSANGEYRCFLIDQSRSGDAWEGWKAASYTPHTAGGEPALVADAQTYAVMNDMHLGDYNHPGTDEPSPGLGLEVEMETLNFAHGGAADALASAKGIGRQTLKFAVIQEEKFH